MRAAITDNPPRMAKPIGKTTIVRSYLLPALLLFAMPAFGIWFAGHSERAFDAQFLTEVERSVRSDAELAPERKEEILAFYRANPPSFACADTSAELASYRENLGEGCDPYWHFGWIRKISWASTGLGAFSALIILLSALLAFASRPAQYLSLRIGWNVLKVAGALQTLLQGTLAVFLSYWVTAVWADSYYPKLILMVIALAGLAVINLVLAIFRRPPSGLDVEGELIDEASAPELWGRIRQICASLRTEPPAHVVVGIDDNFFVTEGEVRVGEHRLEGRTLYLSLSLLRALQRSETDAVLAHEMAHFSGGDTTHSKKLAPLLSHFGQYLGALYEGVITRPIFHFMHAYYGLFQLSLGTSNRRRELAADSVAAKTTSPDDAARALVKVGAYASYRGRVESELFAKDEQHGELAIADRVARGFQGYVRSEALAFDLHESVTPHPFDSHPPLRDRLANLGVALSAEECQRVLLDQAPESWVKAIHGADEIEHRLWATYEARFNQAHDLMLAYRYLPETDAERAHVVKHFPPVTFEPKKAGGPSVELDFEKVACSGWDAPVPYASIKKAQVQDAYGLAKTLKLHLKDAGLFGGTRTIALGKLTNGGAMLEAFNGYYGRHKAALEYNQKKATAAVASAQA